MLATLAMLQVLLCILNPAGFFPDVRGFAGMLFLLCQWAFLSKRSLMLALITEQEALPWHHFDTQVFPHSSPGQAVATEAKLPSVSDLTVCIRAWFAGFPSSEPTCVSM